MTRDDLFKINAGIVKGLIEGVAENCPNAAKGVFNPKKLFGVTTLDVVRAETFVQSVTGTKDPSKTKIPVIGGHSGATIVPLFSAANPAVNVPEDKLDALTNREFKQSVELPYQ